jgi:hypothetical protein
MQFITPKPNSPPARHFPVWPLYLRPEWNTTLPRQRRMQAIAVIATRPCRTPRPLSYHLQVRATRTLFMAAE